MDKSRGKPSNFELLLDRILQLEAKVDYLEKRIRKMDEPGYVQAPAPYIPFKGSTTGR